MTYCSRPLWRSRLIPWLTSETILTYLMLTASYPKTLSSVFLYSAFYDTTGALQSVGKFASPHQEKHLINGERKSMGKSASWLPGGCYGGGILCPSQWSSWKGTLAANNSNFDNNALWLVLLSSLSPCSVIPAASQLTTCIQIIVSGSAFGETCLILLFDITT